MTNKEQHDLAKKFPDKDIEAELVALSEYLVANQDLLTSSATKTKALIDGWFSGASATR